MPTSRTIKANKGISVMAWIEDAFGGVVLVRQIKGGRRWTLPGGKVKNGEALIAALRREVREEIGLEVATASPLDILDRPAAGSITILYRVLLKPGVFKPGPREIEKIGIRRRLPRDCSVAASFFWRRAEQCFEPFSLFAYPTRGRRGGT
ncbi:MAG: NUDIX hydrolase [Chthoniobacterales bacterium]